MNYLERRIESLKRAVEELYDDRVRQRRMLADLLYNLDGENMPAIKGLIERYRSENGEAIAALTLRADENGAAVTALAEKQTELGASLSAVELKAESNSASIESVASVQTEQAESIASIAQAASENAASIESVAAVQTELAEAVASVSQKADENEASVKIAVEASRAAADAASSAEGSASSAESAASAALERIEDGAYIIARVNADGSLVKIKASKLELSGYATFASLSTPGATVIDGANLKTGTVVADSIALNENGQINFDNLGELYFYDPSGANGYIRLSTNEENRGEIDVRTDGTVALNAGNSYILLYDGGGDTELTLNADVLRVNGWQGISGTYTFGTGSITVKNGIVVAATSGDGGSGGGTQTPSAPQVDVNASTYRFTITNPNEAGTIYYYSYSKDSMTGETKNGATYSSTAATVSGYIETYPDNGGTVGVKAWVSYNGKNSSTTTGSVDYA